MLVGRKLVKEQERIYKAQQQKAKQTGVRVDNVPPDINQSRFKGGEYVDYEEVK